MLKDSREEMCVPRSSLHLPHQSQRPAKQPVGHFTSRRGGLTWHEFLPSNPNYTQRWPFFGPPTTSSRPRDMAPISTKRGRGEEEGVRRPKKKMRVKKQTEYHSSSEDEEEPSEVAKPTPLSLRPVVAPKPILKQRPTPPQLEGDEPESGLEEEDGIDEVEKNTAWNAGVDRESDADEGEDEVEEQDADSATPSEEDDSEDPESETETSSMTSSNATRVRKKRNDPDAFATSISRILDTKLTTSKRQDPVLSRSKSAADANKSLSDAKLEQKARAQIRAEKKQALDKGRVKDVLALEAADVDTGVLLEEEKTLRKTAQRGVVKLFNAVRAAQVKAEEGVRQARTEGVVGMRKREERVVEMSKQGFLDLISSGGKQTPAA